MMMGITNEGNAIMSKQVIVQDLKRRIDQLEEKVEELDTFSDSINTQLNIVNELLSIMREFSSGRKIYNRAVNRVELKHLKYDVLVRRKEALEELKKENMPKAIKESFIAKQLKMIASVINHIKHRTKFEEASASVVSELLQKAETNMIKQKVFKKLST